MHPECIKSFNEIKVVKKLCHVSYRSTLNGRERELWVEASAFGERWDKCCSKNLINEILKNVLCLIIFDYICRTKKSSLSYTGNSSIMDVTHKLSENVFIINLLINLFKFTKPLLIKCRHEKKISLNLLFLNSVMDMKKHFYFYELKCTNLKQYYQQTEKGWLFI